MKESLQSFREEMQKASIIPSAYLPKTKIKIPKMDLSYITKSISSAIQDFLKEAVREFIQSIDIDKLKEILSEEHQRFAMVMFEANWIPSDSLYHSDVKDILKIHDAGGIEAVKKEIDQFFLTRFNENELLSILNSWKARKWLKKRVPILEQIINAHISGNYYVSVPALLAQIEGIIAEGYGHYGKMYQDNLKKYLSKLLNDKYFDMAIQEFYFQIILAKFEHGLTLNSFLSRHAILHGADIKYGTATNSLKCILLFDYLQDKFGVATVGNGKSYHRIGCPVLYRKGAERKVYDSYFDAKAGGKKPCKLCKP